jgi:hypothetical protein
MALDYPANTIWHIQSWIGAKADLCEGSAVAIRLQKKKEPQTAKTYLLTCAHVVRGELGGNRFIRCWPPGVGYNDKQAKIGEVEVAFKELPAGKPSEAERRDAADDWAILRIEDANAVAAAPAIKEWVGDAISRDFRIYGYPAGEGGFPEGIVVPIRMPGEFQCHSTSPGIVRLTGDATRAGVSGGGVFQEEGMQFAGLHRARLDAALQVHAVSAFHILSILQEQGYEPAWSQWPPPTETLVSDLNAINLEPFIAEIRAQLSCEPSLLDRLEAQFKENELEIEKSQLGADATEAQARADALARTLIEHDFADVSDVMKDVIEQCSARNEERERQILFAILCWFIPAYDPRKAEKLRGSYERGDVHLIEVEVASALAAELLVSAMQKRRASIARDDADKGRWTGVSALSAQKLPLGLGADEEDQVIRTVERWLIHLLEFDSDFNKSPDVYRPSLLKILQKNCKPGKNLPYVVFSIASHKGSLRRDDLEKISSAIHNAYPTLATLLLSSDNKVHADEPARLYSLTQILKRIHQ